MVFRPSFLLLMVFLVSLSLLGCGMLGFGGDGDESDPDSMDLIDFGDDLPTPEPEQAVAQALSVDPESLVEIGFLYSFQVRLERLRRMVRDLDSSNEYSSPADINLEWVADVHEVTREADAFFKELTSMEIPGSQRVRYEYLYIGMLEAVQIAGFGSDRLLAAAVLVGPSGRSLPNMTPAEVDRFEALIRESQFFLRDAERRVDGEIEGVGEAVSALRVR